MKKLREKFPPEHDFFDLKFLGWRIHAFLDDGTFFMYVIKHTRNNKWIGFRISPEAGSMFIDYRVEHK